MRLAIPEKDYEVIEKECVKISPVLEPFNAAFNYSEVSLHIEDESIADPINVSITKKRYLFVVKGVSPGRTKAVIKFRHSSGGGPLEELRTEKFNIIVRKEE